MWVWALILQLPGPLRALLQQPGKAALSGPGCSQAPCALPSQLPGVGNLPIFLPHPLLCPHRAQGLVSLRATGREVFDWILDQGYYSERDTSNVVRQVLEAVAYLHSLKIVHRNLKVRQELGQRARGLPAWGGAAPGLSMPPLESSMECPPAHPHAMPAGQLENLVYYNRLKNSKIVISDFHLAKLENGLIKEPCGTPEYLGKQGAGRGQGGRQPSRSGWVAGESPSQEAGVSGTRPGQA